MRSPSLTTSPASMLAISALFLRQRQGLDLNSLVLSDGERASAADPVIVKLIELTPRANFVDSSGTPRFVGSATALVDVYIAGSNLNFGGPSPFPSGRGDTTFVVSDFLVEVNKPRQLHRCRHRLRGVSQ